MREFINRLDLRPPVTEAAITACSQQIGKILPMDYVEFLQIANGGEGLLGGTEYIILWSAEELPSMNTAYNIQDYVPGLLIFGSNGGGEAYGFDTRHLPWNIVSVPFVGMSWDLARPMGTSFASFLRGLSKEGD